MPLLSRGGRWIFAGVVGLTLVLLTLGRIDHPAIASMRAVATDAASPVLAVLSRPVERGQAGLRWLGSLGALVAENDRLREENDRLKGWQAAALALERENERLRALMKAPELEVEPVAAPRVIGMAGGPFVRAVLINAGTGEQVADGQPVIDEHGLVGRVLEAGAASSRVLLVTDLNSRVPVKLQASGHKAIARGHNDDLLELVFLAPDAIVAPGDRVVTTGDGGVFPPDILVGEVTGVAGRKVLVQPAAMLERLDFVLVLQAVGAMLAVEPEAEDTP